MSYKIISISKKFNNNSRLLLNKEGQESEGLMIDVHNIFFDLFEPSKSFNIVLSNDYEDNHSYTMTGRCFSVQDNDILLSFGGLLMKCQKVPLLSYDKEIYCYIDHT
jgi:hypothetical protein